MIEQDRERGRRGKRVLNSLSHTRSTLPPTPPLPPEQSEWMIPSGEEVVGEAKIGGGGCGTLEGCTGRNCGDGGVLWGRARELLRTKGE